MSGGWTDVFGWGDFEGVFFCWSTDPLAMDQEESLVDEEKLNFINSAGQEYATVDCGSKAGQDRERCFLVRSTLRGFALGMQDIRSRLSKCTEMIEEGPYTSGGTSGYVSCMNSIEAQLKGLVEEHFEKLSGLGFSHSS